MQCCLIKSISKVAIIIINKIHERTSKLIFYESHNPKIDENLLKYNSDSVQQRILQVATTAISKVKNETSPDLIIDIFQFLNPILHGSVCLVVFIGGKEAPWRVMFAGFIIFLSIQSFKFLISSCL